MINFNLKEIEFLKKNIESLKALVELHQASAFEAERKLREKERELKEVKKALSDNESLVSRYERDQEELYKSLKLGDKRIFRIRLVFSSASNTVIKSFKILKETITKQHQKIKKQEARIKLLEGIHLAHYGTLPKFEEVIE